MLQFDKRVESYSRSSSETVAYIQLNRLYTQTVVTSTLKISDCIHALSCMMSLIETPIEAISRHSSAMPPGRSLTVTENLRSRPSHAKPLSRHRPSIVVSMLPPHSGITTLTEKQ